MDNLRKAEAKRLEIIHKIQELYQEGISIRQISRITGKNRKTVRKYLTGDPENLCRSNKKGNLESYRDFIIESITGGMTQTSILEELRNMGYGNSNSNARRYISVLAWEQNLELAKYKEKVSGRKGEEMSGQRQVTRKSIFNYLWMNGELPGEVYDYVWEAHPVLQKLEACIRQFREIFRKKNMSLLYLFIERYRDTEIRELSGFAKSLSKDIGAIENAVASELSNGLVEGTNSRVKMVKRTMYGRCGRELLAAKLIFQI